MIEIEKPNIATINLSEDGRNGKFIVEGEWLYNFMGQINFSDYESLNFFQRVLQNSGVFTALEEKGCRDGHTVSIYGFEFDYVK